MRLQPFFKVRLNIFEIHQDNLEFLVYHNSDLRTTLIIPRSLKNGIKMILHADHRRDLARVKKRAQEHVFWPSMNTDLKSYIEQCVHCQVHMLSHPKAPIFPFQ